MDTSILEKIAEQRISSELQRHELLVAKPYNDQNGTDLLAFLQISDGVKFCRIQSKGRSLKESNNTNVTIPRSYVTNGFIAFLYLELPDLKNDLFVFFPSDIRNWKEHNNEYHLYVSVKHFQDKLDFYRFDESKAKLIKDLIAKAEMSGEFKILIYGSANVQAQPAKVSGIGNVIAKCSECGTEYIKYGDRIMCDKCLPNIGFK